MRSVIIYLFSLLSALALAAECLLFANISQWVIVATAVMLVGSLLLLHRAVVKPMRTIISGVNLVREQDFSSRLARVGQHDADRLVDLFNSMMDKLKQERLRQHEQNHFLNLLIEASPMGVVICDFEGNQTMMNPAAKKMVQGELAGIINSVAMNESKTVRMADNSIFRVSRLWFMEMGFRRPFVLIESLTDEVRLAEKEAYGKVIRMISHEVNNSMAGMKSLLETLADIMTEDADMTELIESCHERCTSMSSFITSYADVVKMPDATLVCCDLNECISRQIPFVEGLLPENISLTLCRADVPAVAMVDTVLLEQAVVNIVKNAVESIGSDCGEIKITISATPSAAIDIDDSGPGIAPEIANRLFTPFLTNKPNGQGIGLLCISEVLHRHNCTFSLATVAPSVTRFHISFPPCNPPV